MQITENIPPRTYTVGVADKKIELSDCAHIQLAADEQVTFVTPSGTELDVTRKAWGYYATSSLNSRLLHFHLSAALVRSTQDNKFFILLVESGQENTFFHYLKETYQELVCWLNSDENLGKIAALFKS